MKTNDSKKIKSLIKKVKELADRGDDNERDVAKMKLAELMNKYNLKKFEPKIKKRSFKLANYEDCKDIMVHCIIDTNSKSEIEGSLQKKELYVKLTDEEYVDVCEKFNHYYPEYYKQKQLLLKAFILKNEIGIVQSENDEQEDTEIEDLVSVLNFVKEKRYSKNPFLIAS
jgi:hypothetical protein